MHEVVSLRPDPEPDPARSADPRSPDLLELIVLASIGAVTLAAERGADLVRRSARVSHPGARPQTPLTLPVGAALGLGMRGLHFAIGGARAVLKPATFLASMAFGHLFAASESAAKRSDRDWRTEREVAVALAGETLAEATRATVLAVLDQLDLTELVMERVDLDRIVSSVDLDEAVSRVDLDAVVARLDINTIAERVDLDTIAKRLDVDAVADRIDVERLVQRLDLAALALMVIQEIDLPEIIRESATVVSSDAVRGVRMRTVDADETLASMVDRVLRRIRTER